MSEFNPMKTALSRVWLIDGGARVDHTPSFQSCLKAMAISAPKGDIERIECPDPDEFGQFIEVGIIQGAEERETSSLVGRYPLSSLSELLRLANKRCSFDYQINIGDCQDPTNFNDFQKKVIREDTYGTTYSTDDLGALSSDENAVVNETLDVSSKSVYEVIPLSLTSRADDVIDNPGVDVVICDRPSCGSCVDESDGCEVIFVLATNTPGSPGTAPDVIWSIDKAQNWAEDDINSLLASEEANAIACVGDYLVVVSNDSGSLHYKLIADVIAGTALGWVENDTGFETGGEPNDIWSVGDFAFIVGDGGYVYSLVDPVAGVTVLDAGIATTENLVAVHAISNQFAIAAGENDAIVYTENQTIWQAPTNVTGTGDNLLSVWAKSRTEWIAGTDAGELWYTVDGGFTAWTEKGLPGTLYTEINDIFFSTKSVGYIAATRTIGGVARGQVLRTYSGGGGTLGTGAFITLPEQAGKIIPDSTAMMAVAGCNHDVNFFVSTGTETLDGIIIVGE